MSCHFANNRFIEHIDCRAKFLPQSFVKKGYKAEGGLRFQGVHKHSLPQNPLVTVITVVFNGAETLHDTIKSIMTQSYSNIEHIIIDGGSSDATVDILRQYDHVIDYWVSEKDLGIYDAMNKGIINAKGDIIGFLNSDDIYNGNYILEKVVESFLYGKYEAIFSDLIYVKNSRTNDIVRRYSSKEFSPSKIAYGWMPAHPTLYLCKEVFEKYGLFKVDYKIAGDYELVARLFCKYKISYQYLPMDMVKMNIGGISSRWKNTLLLNKEVVRACKENGINTNLFKICSKYPKKICELFFN